mmetsp:Transcript_29206/g.57190  ORF Transcript_29206/g.57190 Transcript_29206/m.57190 type:complete len:335 (+) Transcript_29206:103-1107(+)
MTLVDSAHSAAIGDSTAERAVEGWVPGFEFQIAAKDTVTQDGGNSVNVTCDYVVGSEATAEGFSMCLNFSALTSLTMLPVTDVVSVGRTSRCWRAHTESDFLWQQILARDYAERSSDSRRHYILLFGKLRRLSREQLCDVRLRFLFVGDAGVGKSSFVSRLVSQTFEPSFGTLRAELRSFNVQFRSLAVKVQVCAQNPLKHMRAERLLACQYRSTHGVILMYDQSDRDSFLSLGKWHEDIHKFGRTGVQTVVCGNKCDLSRVEVVPEEGAAFASDIKSVFLRTSCKTGFGVEATVRHLLERCACQPELWIQHERPPRPVVQPPPSLRITNCCVQ